MTDDGDKLHVEALQLKCDQNGAITGYCDANNDGQFNDYSCTLENGTFDLDEGEIYLEQVFPPGVRGMFGGLFGGGADEEDGETTSWSATYDPSTDSFVEGEWKDEEGDVTGTFTAVRQESINSSVEAS